MDCWVERNEDDVLLLSRHGRTLQNRLAEETGTVFEDRWLIIPNLYDLDESGASQASRLGDYLKIRLQAAKPPYFVISSLPRTRQTAEIASKKIGMVLDSQNLIAIPGLDEALTLEDVVRYADRCCSFRNLLDAEFGRSQTDRIVDIAVSEGYSAAMEYCMLNRSWSPDRLELRSEMSERVGVILGDLMYKYSQDRQVIAILHGVINKAFTEKMPRECPASFLDYPDNCGLMEIEWSVAGFGRILSDLDNASLASEVEA